MGESVGGCESSSLPRDDPVSDGLDSLDRSDSPVAQFDVAEVFDVLVIG